MTVLSLLVGPMLTTETLLDWSPVTTLPPVLPPELVETLVLLEIVPLEREEPPKSGSAGAGTMTGAGTTIAPPSRGGRSSRPAASTGDAASRRPAAASASEVRIRVCFFRIINTGTKQ